MKNCSRYFKDKKIIPIDQFFDDVLYNKKYGYYSKNMPFGDKGDFVTSPSISFLFGEMISIWIKSVWEKLNRPEKICIVELGPGTGQLMNRIVETLGYFPEIFSASKFFLYEKSQSLKKIQKKKLIGKKVKWISKVDEIKEGPIIFIGNEFFDAIAIKQFIRKKKEILEVCIGLDKGLNIKRYYRKAQSEDIFQLKKFNTLKKLNFLELPKLGFLELDPIINKIKKYGGGIMLIDYGYLNQINKSSLQSVKKHKKNEIFENIGSADITSLVNFSLLKEYFESKKIKVEKIVTQSFFLKKMGILQRAEIVSKKMNFKDKSDLYFRLKRLLDIKLMGELFKVIFAHRIKGKKIIGFY